MGFVIDCFNFFTFWQFSILYNFSGETRNENETSTVLRAVILAVSNQLECHRKYISDGGVTNRMFCAYELKKDSCAGMNKNKSRLSILITVYTFSRWLWRFAEFVFWTNFLKIKSFLFSGPVRTNTYIFFFCII